MTKPVSCIYEGTVRHVRRTPLQNAFVYRLFLMYVDLDELPGLFDNHPLWSARRPAVAWFRRSDYLGDARIPLDAAVRDLVAERTGERPAGPVRVLTNLRYFGHCFNPVSFYYCFDPDGEQVRSVVAEVTNTPWGERYSYVAGELNSRHDKQLHVSPFWGMDSQYEWRIGEPREQLEVSIGSDRDGERIFEAALSLRRKPITRAALTRLLVGQPPMTMKVSAAIYAEALKLRVKGVRPHPHPRMAAQ